MTSDMPAWPKPIAPADRITDSDRDREYEAQLWLENQDRDAVAAAEEKAYRLLHASREIWNDGDQDAAIQTLRSALESSPKTLIALELARACESVGDPAGALMATAVAYACRPRNNDAALSFAKRLAAHGDARRAWWIAMEILNRCPDDRPAREFAAGLEAQP